MGRPLRVLIVEDNPDDAELVVRELTRGGFRVQWERVQTARDMTRALAEEAWDVVLSDYSLPEFSAPAALSELHRSGVDLPFLIISGTVGEETAVESLKAGAHDFLLKGRLARLVPAIHRELRDASERAERRAAQKAAEEAMREKLRAEAASQAKSNFLAHMSHELRTPLTAIIGFSELLMQGVAGELQGGQQEFVSQVLASSQHLLALINDVLDLSKIEAGRLQISMLPTGLAPVAEEATALLGPLAQKQGVELQVAIPPGLPPITADPMRLRQILFNLLSNAIKFTPAGGRVRLTAGDVGPELAIAVADTGVGIVADDLPKLFGRFEQLEPGKRSGTGTGLGLALTKALVELHGGSIDVTSEPGQGSIFTVRIPLAQPGEAAEPETGTLLGSHRRLQLTGGHRTTRACVLIVEDDPPSRKLVRAILERRGHEVLEASTVEEARDLLWRRMPDVVLTDIEAPGGGGRQLLKDIRQDGATAHLPVLATTAHAMQGDRERLLAEGFDGYIGKPIDTRGLAKAVESFLGGEVES